MTTVLSVGLSAAILTSNTDDVRERQLRYAEAIGGLHIVVPRENGLGPAPVTLSDSLRVYPVAKPNWPLYVPNAIRVAGEIARRERIDLITVQDPFVGGLIGTYCKRRRRWPLEIQSHSTFFDNPHWIAERPLTHRLLNVFGKVLLKQADGWRVSNDHQRGVYMRLGLPAGRVRVIPIPINLSRFEQPISDSVRAAVRAQWGAGPDDFVFAWVGRPVRFKNLPTLLKAAAMLFAQQPSARLVLAGDFSAAQDLRGLAESLGLGGRVVWPGPAPHAEVPTLMRAADAYVLPSWYEGLARVLMEAAASELPIVAARSPGVTDAVLDGDTGLLADPADPADLANAMARLMSDRPRARLMGRRGLELVKEKFNPIMLQTQIVTAWRELGGRA